MIRRAAAELVGTAFLVAAVVGSGIAAQRLSPDDLGLQLLESALATAAALVAIILALAPVSGAHLNPVITLADLTLGGLRMRQAAAYVGAQIVGGGVGAIAANLMYGLAPLKVSTHDRIGAAQESIHDQTGTRLVEDTMTVHHGRNGPVGGLGPVTFSKKLRQQRVEVVARNRSDFGKTARHASPDDAKAELWDHEIIVH